MDQSHDEWQSVFKHRLCKSWAGKGECHYGSRCLFAHGDVQLLPPPTYSDGTTTTHSVPTTTATKGPSVTTACAQVLPNPAPEARSFGRTLARNNTVTTTAPPAYATLGHNGMQPSPPYYITDAKGNVLAVLHTLNATILKNMASTSPPMVTPSPAGIKLMKEVGEYNAWNE